MSTNGNRPGGTAPNNSLVQIRRELSQGAVTPRVSAIIFPTNSFGHTMVLLLCSRTFPLTPQHALPALECQAGDCRVSLESAAGLSPRTSPQDARRPVSFGLSPGGFAGGESLIWVTVASSQPDVCLSFTGSWRQAPTWTCGPWGRPSGIGNLRSRLLPVWAAASLLMKCICKMEQRESQEGNFSAVLRQ